MDSFNGRPRRTAEKKNYKFTQHFESDSENEINCVENDNDTACSVELQENYTRKKKNTPATKRVKKFHAIGIDGQEKPIITIDSSSGCLENRDPSLARAVSTKTNDARTPSLARAVFTKANDASTSSLARAVSTKANYARLTVVHDVVTSVDRRCVNTVDREEVLRGRKKFLPDRINEADYYVREHIIHSDTLGCNIKSEMPPKNLMPNTTNEYCCLSKVPKSSYGYLQGLRQHDWFCRNDFSGELLTHDEVVGLIGDDKQRPTIVHIARHKEPLSPEDIAADKNKCVILQQQHHIVTIDGDRNCFHRAVSYHIYGNEENHQLVRDKICNHIRANKKVFRDLGLGESSDFDECLLARRQDGKCADLIDVAAAMHAFKHSIRMFSSFGPAEGVKHGPYQDEIRMFRRHPKNDDWCHYDLLIPIATQVATATNASKEIARVAVIATGTSKEIAGTTATNAIKEIACSTAAATSKEIVGNVAAADSKEIVGNVAAADSKEIVAIAGKENTASDDEKLEKFKQRYKKLSYLRQAKTLGH